MHIAWIGGDAVTLPMRHARIQGRKSLFPPRRGGKAHTGSIDSDELKKVLYPGCSDVA